MTRWRVTYQPWLDCGPSPHLEALGDVATLTDADRLIAQHHGRAIWGGPVSAHPTFGAATRDADYALHLIRTGTYRISRIA